MLYCSFEIVKAMFLQKGKFMILECEKCISLHFVPTKIHKSFETVRFNSCFLYLCSAKTGSYYKERLYYTKRLYN